MADYSQGRDAPLSQHYPAGRLRSWWSYLCSVPAGPLSSAASPREVPELDNCDYSYDEELECMVLNNNGLRALADAGRVWCARRNAGDWYADSGRNIAAALEYLRSNNLLHKDFKDADTAYVCALVGVTSPRVKVAENARIVAKLLLQGYDSVYEHDNRPDYQPKYNIRVHRMGVRYVMRRWKEGARAVVDLMDKQGVRKLTATRWGIYTPEGMHLDVLFAPWYDSEESAAWALHGAQERTSGRYGGEASLTFLDNAVIKSSTYSKKVPNGVLSWPKTSRFARSLYGDDTVGATLDVWMSYVFFSPQAIGLGGAGSWSSRQAAGNVVVDAIHAAKRRQRLFDERNNTQFLNSIAEVAADMGVKPEQVQAWAWLACNVRTLWLQWLATSDGGRKKYGNFDSFCDAKMASVLPLKEAVLSLVQRAG